MKINFIKSLVAGVARILFTFLSLSIFASSSLAQNKSVNHVENLSKEEIETVLHTIHHLTSFTKDIPNDYKPFDKFRRKGSDLLISVESEPSPCRGSCEDLVIYCDELDVPVTFPDPYGNGISFFGTYGPDSRQKYYVYIPTNPDNGKVVVLVHGGAWFGGPDPDEIIGFPLKYSSSSASLVGDLLDEGYVVVSLLYRLSKLGSTQAQIDSNALPGFIMIDSMLKDIDSAINHL